jgi:hypothetical protein
VDELTEKELANFKIIKSDLRKKYRVDWAKYFAKYLSFKQPYIINGA